MAKNDHAKWVEEVQVIGQYAAEKSKVSVLAWIALARLTLAYMASEETKSFSGAFKNALGKNLWFTCLPWQVSSLLTECSEWGLGGIAILAAGGDPASERGKANARALFKLAGSEKGLNKSNLSKYLKTEESKRPHPSKADIRQPEQRGKGKGKGKGGTANERALSKVEVALLRVSENIAQKRAPLFGVAPEGVTLIAEFLAILNPVMPGETTFTAPVSMSEEQIRIEVSSKEEAAKAARTALLEAEAKAKAKANASAAKAKAKAAAKAAKAKAKAAATAAA